MAWEAFMRNLLDYVINGESIFSAEQRVMKQRFTSRIWTAIYAITAAAARNSALLYA